MTQKIYQRIRKSALKANMIALRLFLLTCKRLEGCGKVTFSQEIRGF